MAGCSWHRDFMCTLRVRDSGEHAGKNLYENYQKLADRTSGEEQSLLIGSISHRPPPVPDKIVHELAAAQKSRSTLEASLTSATKNLKQLQHAFLLEKERARTLALEKTALLVKLRDREEELKAKGKLLEDIHNETIALTLQLNIVDEQNQKIKAENTELVDRWMKRVGHEAEALNSASEFP